MGLGALMILPRASELLASSLSEITARLLSARRLPRQCTYQIATIVYNTQRSLAIVLSLLFQ